MHDLKRHPLTITSKDVAPDRGVEMLAKAVVLMPIAGVLVAVAWWVWSKVN